MKLKLFIIFTFCGFLGFSQNQLEIIKIKGKNNSISISAKNRSNYIYDMTVDIALTGMNSDREFPYTFRIKPGESYQITLLTPDTTKQDRNYKIHYRAEPEDRSNSLLMYDVIEPNITIYTKNNHAESTYLSRYLKKNAIPFIEVNVDYNEETLKRYNDMIQRRSIQPDLVKFPVVIYRGEINSNIKDIEDFCTKKIKTVKKS